MNKIFIVVAAIFLLMLNVVAYSHKTTSQIINVPLVSVPVPVQVKVTVANANYVETISICNISGTTIPLTNIEFDFNYAIAMPTNIWGQPWAAWKRASQTGTAVVLKGGTPYTPALLPDPNCLKPLTIQFNASPTSPAPTGPFVFKAEGAIPSGQGALTVTLPTAPAPNLNTPTITVSGPNFSQQQALNWGGSWQLTNLAVGSYTISATPVNNGNQFYVANNVTVLVKDKTTTVQAIQYQPVASANVTVTLVGAPAAQQPLVFTGSSYTINKTVSSGSQVNLPYGTYTVSSTVPGYTATVVPNPLTVPTNTTLTVTYTQNQTSSGPYKTSNGQIIDKNGNAVTFKGVSWFGFNTGNHVVHGLWQADFTRMLNQIKSLGFNAVRIPFQFDFVLNPAIRPTSITTSCNGTPCNQDVPQDSALNTFQWVVNKFTSAGIYVLLDDHYEDNTYVTNQAQWIAGWQKVAQLFINNPAVGYDLYNEPDSHSLTWEGSNSGTPWANGITAAATAIYAIDTQKLIFIEGTGQTSIKANWGDGFATDNATVSQNISNPKNFFTQLASKPYVNQIVISPHMYGPNGTNNQGPDHSNQAVAYADWSRLNGYLLNNFLNINNTSQSGFCIGTTCRLYPIALGEFGGKFDPADPNYTKDVATLVNVATYLTRLGVGKPAQPSWFYWDWNPNSGNTGGILKDDWLTIDCNKVNYLKQYLSLTPASGICGS